MKANYTISQETAKVIEALEALQEAANKVNEAATAVYGENAVAEKYFDSFVELYTPLREYVENLAGTSVGFHLEGVYNKGEI